MPQESPLCGLLNAENLIVSNLQVDGKMLGEISAILIEKSHKPLHTLEHRREFGGYGLNLEYRVGQTARIILFRQGRSHL